MSKHSNLTTVQSLQCALNVAKTVYIQPRFGCSERWIKISKKEAQILVSNLEQDATPQNAEMYTNVFGTLNGTLLYMG